VGLAATLAASVGGLVPSGVSHAGSEAVLECSGGSTPSVQSPTASGSASVSEPTIDGITAELEFAWSFNLNAQTLDLQVGVTGDDPSRSYVITSVGFEVMTGDGLTNYVTPVASPTASYAQGFNLSNILSTQALSIPSIFATFTVCEGAPVTTDPEPTDPPAGGGPRLPSTGANTSTTPMVMVAFIVLALGMVATRAARRGRPAPR